MENDIDVKEILEFYLRSGVDETCGNDVFFRLDNQKKIEKNENVVVRSVKQVSSNLAFDINGAVEKACELCDGVSSITELVSIIRDFDGCSLKNTAQNTVVGEGSDKAKVMFIGKAPEADDDRVGRIMVGKNGQLWDKMLSAVGLNRDVCYICNILPWRPPGGRSPSDFEQAVCLPFLRKQIEIVNPDIIFALGEGAVNVLLGNADSISKIRGKWFEYKLENGKVISVMAGYHPGYFLKNPTQKAKAWGDLLRLKKKIEENNDISC